MLISNSIRSNAKLEGGKEIKFNPGNEKTNRLALVSFISGLIVIVILSFGILWQRFPPSQEYANTIRIILDFSVTVQILCALITLITGILALREIKKKAGNKKSKIFAWVGILIGAGYILYGLLVFIVFSAQFLT